MPDVAHAPKDTTMSRLTHFMIHAKADDHGPIYEMGGCRRSRGCSDFGTADWRVVVEATMRSLVVVVVVPRFEVGVSLL